MPRAEADPAFFDRRPPHAPFGALMRRDPFRHVFRIRDAAWRSALVGMPLAPGDRFLDVGGGNGVIADRMHALRGVRGVCVDRAMLGLIEARDDGIAVTPIRADALALPFATSAFDGTASFEMFEHIANWPGAVRELVRVTRPGGHIVATAVSSRWSGTWNWWLDRAGVDIHSYADHDPARFVDPADLRRAFLDAGADVLELRELNAFGTLAFDEVMMVAALVVDRGPATLARKFMRAASLLRRALGPVLVLSELPWRLAGRSNSILIVARKTR